MRSPLAKWVAPKWMPMFIRQRYLGVWTQSDVDRINAEAKRMHDEINGLL